MFCSLLNQITLSSQGPELDEGSLEDRRMKQKLIRPNKKRAASYLLIFWNFQTKWILTMMYPLKKSLKYICIFVSRIWWIFHLFHDSPITWFHLFTTLHHKKTTTNLITEMNHNSRIVFSGEGKLYFIKWILIRTEMKHRFPGNIWIKSWYKCFKAAGKWHLA